MNRLVCLLLFPAVFSSFASAQPSVHYYSVAGDVASPQTYQYDAGQRVSVLDLLNHAGIGEQFGHAVVLRRSPLHVVAVCPVQPGMNETGSSLTPGDLVVFRSQSGAIPNQPNALVLIHSVPDVLPLTETPRSLDSLVQQLHLTPLHEISVMRTALATPATVLLPGTEYIQHGDVVDLSGLVPPGRPPGQLYAIAPVDIYGTEQPDGTEQGDTAPFGTDYLAGQTDDATLGGSLLSIDDSASGVQMEFLSADNDSSQDTNHNPFRVTSLSEIKTPAEPPAIAADSEVGLHRDSAGSTILNAVFIAGLVFATGLIFVGWLRTKHERQAEGVIPGILSKSPRNDAATLKNNEEDHLQSVTTIQRSADVPEQRRETQADGSAESVEVRLDDPAVDTHVGSEGSEATSSTPPGGWKDLEDLIQNRLPIEQKQAQLPLRVSLFGRPAGPQRLRIDAPHKQVPSPHIPVSDADSRQTRQKVAAVPASAFRKANSTPAHVDERETVGTDFSRLDQALNYLEEQSDS